MSRGGIWLRRAVWASVLGATGCASVFGFEYPETTCARDSDCGQEYACVKGVCALAETCAHDSDCAGAEICSYRGTCVLADAATADAGALVDAAVPDAAVPDAVDESAVASSAEGGGAGQDAPGACEIGPGITLCGACASDCPTGFCVSGVCAPTHEVFPQGYDLPYPVANTTPAQLVGPGNGDAGAAEFVAQPIHPGPGVLTGLGVLAEYAGVHVYAGLYTNDNMQPGKLVVGSTEFVTDGATPPSPGNPLQTMVAVSPTLIDDTDYWLVTVWQSDDFVVEEFPQSECTALSGQSCLPTYALYGPPFEALPAIAQAQSSSDLPRAPPMGFFAVVTQL